jgi:hypothetical protein
MSKYVEIKDELLSVFRSIEQQEGEITEDLEDKLNTLSIALQDKVNFYYSIIASIEEEIKEAKEIADKYAKIAKSKEKKKFFFEERVLDIIKNFGEQNVTDKEGLPLYKLKVNYSEVLEIVNEDKIPEDFMVVKITKSPDKNAIKRAIKNGILENTDDYYILQKENLQVK